ncbi:MAG TPA: glycosyltransferase 87 family protein [Pyrinomonadaceae bacterium]|jgi:hypothetical protein
MIKSLLVRRADSWGGLLSVTNLTLVVIGAASLVLYRTSLRAPLGEFGIVWFVRLALVQAVLYFVAVWMILRARASRSTLVVVIVFAALFRLAVLFAPPYLSSDIYRYIWDGRVQAAGMNPYRYVPADAALAHLRDAEIYTQINRSDYAHTIYPPVAQFIYFLMTRVSERVVWMKAVLCGFEALAVWALWSLLASFGMGRERVLVYAWHPLLVWETAWSGHIDAAAIAFIALALLARQRRMETATGIALACAVLVKLYPVVLFPALYRRWGWRMPLAFVVTVAAAYLPYLSVGVGALGFLPGYAAEEGIENGARFFILHAARKLFDGADIPSVVYIVFALLLLAALALWTMLKEEATERSYVGRACALAAVFTVLFSPRYAWYFTWLTPFLCVVPLAPLVYLTAASFLVYGTWLGDKPEQFWASHSKLYVPFALLCAVSYVQRRNRFNSKLATETQREIRGNEKRSNGHGEED